MAPPQRPRKGGKSGKSNVSLLTEGAKYIQRKKKSKANEVEKVVFDDDARRDYLTGFHKRRVAKIEEKRKRQNEEAHQEHLVERKRARDELRHKAKENFKTVRRAMGLEDLDSDDENGPTPGSIYKGKGRATGDDEDDEDEDDDEQEFSDEEQAAVVTIINDADEELGLAPDVLTAPPSAEDQRRIKAEKDAAAAARLAEKERQKLKYKKDSKSVNTMISSDYGSFVTKSERKKDKDAQNLRRKEKMDQGREKRMASRRGGGGRGGKSRGSGRPKR